jgi:hypothetical protein
MRAVTRLSISQQKRMFKNKNEVARKPGCPKKKGKEVGKEGSRACAVI